MRRSIRLRIAGLSTIALRAPRGPAHAVIEAFGAALAAPSANRSGRLSPTRAEHVIEQLGDSVALVLDAGPCAVGLESTILSLAGDRQGCFAPAACRRKRSRRHSANPLDRASTGDPVAAPGMLASHYAPRLPLRLATSSVAPDEALLSFGPGHIPGEERAVATRNLSPSGNLVEAAANLFALLTDLDRSSAVAIVVAPIPQKGLGEAINDRLARAAAPRPPDR